MAFATAAKAGHTGLGNENENENVKDARPRLVEQAWAYSAWSISTNTMRSLCVVIVSLSLPLQCDSALAINSLASQLL